jgi:uncharacterized RDD family membrane protein YckC
MLCTNHATAENVRRCTRCGSPYCSDCLVDIAGRPYCANCKTEQLLDVRSGVDRTQLAFASPWRRFGALFIDNLLLIIPMYALVAVLVYLPASRGETPPTWTSFIGLPFMLVYFIYEGAMLQMRAQTLGKIAMKVKVVRADGSPISTGQAWGRTFMRTIFGCISIFDYLPAFFTKERTTLHDMVASTRVVDI